MSRTPESDAPDGPALRPSVTRDPWTAWRAATPARIALGRAGVALPTDELLRFGWAHALARDAVHWPLNAQALAAQLQADGWAVGCAGSAVPDRSTYLRRPDLGRQLSPASAAALRERRAAAAVDLCFVVGDGLSALAVERHAAPLLKALRPLLEPALSLSPVVVATQARVALGDEIGELFGARLVVVLIGERPGLSSPDSLGVYLTHTPRRGRRDAERNCLSNVRPEGLGMGEAAQRLAWLLREALRRGLTGIGLKDESDALPLSTAGAPASLRDA